MRPRTDDRREIDSAEAKIAHDIERTWRHWKGLIAEKQDELAAQQVDDALDADLTGDSRPAPRKARLDQATRQQFGAVLEARRQQAQAKAEQEARQQGRPAPDADQVYAALLARVADELDGKLHLSGMALVWYKDALIKFDAQAVMAGDDRRRLPGRGPGLPARPGGRQSWCWEALACCWSRSGFWCSGPSSRTRRTWPRQRPQRASGSNRPRSGRRTQPRSAG